MTKLFFYWLKKDFEEFYSANEKIDFETFLNIGIIKNDTKVNDNLLEMFLDQIKIFRSSGNFNKIEIIRLFKKLLPEFQHDEQEKFLDGKM